MGRYCFQIVCLIGFREIYTIYLVKDNQQIVFVFYTVGDFFVTIKYFV